MAVSDDRYWGFEPSTYNRTRYIFYLFLNGAGQKEIATALGISASLVSQEVAKARYQFVGDFDDGMSAATLEKRYQLPIEILADEGRNFCEKAANQCWEKEWVTEGDVWDATGRPLYGITPPEKTRQQRGKEREAGWASSLEKSKIPKADRDNPDDSFWVFGD